MNVTNSDSVHLDTLAEAVPPEIDRLAAALLERANVRERKLATAESCTGGLLASLLTDVIGGSHVFECGFVAYSDAAKMALLGVPEALLEKHGAVSAEAAVAMAHGGIAHSRADLCIAITGYADDGGGRFPAGLVYFALAEKDGRVRCEKREFGDLGRGGVRVACLRTALQMLDAALRGEF